MSLHFQKYLCIKTDIAEHLVAERENDAFSETLRFTPAKGELQEKGKAFAPTH